MMAVLGCLVTAAAPVLARVPEEPPASADAPSCAPAVRHPLLRSGLCATTRLARAMEEGPHGAVTVPRDGDAELGGWSRVSRLAPGTAITVAAKGTITGRRYVIDSGPGGLTLLDLTAPALPPGVKKVLRRVAAHHPAWFQAAAAGQWFRLEENVQIGPDGVTVAGRKTAALSAVVADIPRSDVLEIRGPLRPSPGKDALVGFAVGAALFGGVVAAGSAASGGDARYSGDVVAAAAIGGGVTAGISMASGAVGHALHPRQGVLYRAP